MTSDRDTLEPGPIPVDPHPWRAALALGVLGIVAGLLISMVIPLALGKHQWWTPGDAWRSLRAAHYVAQGWYSLIYETGSHHDVYDSGPLFPLVLAPVAVIGNIFHLRESYPIQRQYPGMWSVFAPYALASAIPLMYAVRALATQCRMVAGKAVVQFLVLALAFVPMAVFYGHYEDVLALALLFLAFRDVFAERGLRGALFVAVAVAFKQWAVLAIPVYVAACAPELRLRAALRYAVPPALFMALFMAFDYPYAGDALLRPPAFPQFGHSALWIPSSSVFLSSAPTRVGAIALAVAVGWFVRKTRDPAAILTALGIVLFARVFFEPVLHAYYLAPGIACLVVAAKLQGRGLVTEVTLASALLLLFPFHPDRQLWWIAFYALSAAFLYGPVRSLVHAVRAAPIANAHPLAVSAPVPAGSTA